ncbi:MAG: GNAT family N-acetyltransferase [Solirubrobacterales bacterium]
MPRFPDPERLASDHVLSGFNCGEGSLNLWLERHARSAGPAGGARTYVITDSDQEDRVVGYHAIATASIEHVDATERAAKGMPRHQISALLLARLAVDKSVQGEGLGAFLLRDAMLRTLNVSDEVGVRLLLAHALNDRARKFYLRFGFEPSPTDPMNLQIIVKDIRATVGGD